jgi:Lrp/AsnC family leucine-responsive transcriptional regulator
VKGLDTVRKTVNRSAILADDLTKFENSPPELDRIDGLILSELQADATLSLGQLGERVGLTAPTVMERVRKLEHAGVITGYHAKLDARKVGLDIAAFIGVSVSDPKCIETVEQWVEGVPEVLECHHVTGAYTLLLKVKVRNTRALEQLINALRAREGVTGTHTMVVFSSSVERIPIALPIPAEDPAQKRRGRPRKKAQP